MHTTTWNLGTPFTSVLDFGADPTGVADSTTAINNAIAAMPAIGGTLYFPAGTYKVSSAITLNKTGRYLGDGRSATTIQTTSATADVFSLSVANLLIENIGFSSSVTRTVGSYINVTSSASNVTIRHFLMNGPFVGITWSAANVTGVISDGVIQNTAIAAGSIALVANNGQFTFENSLLYKIDTGIQINNSDQLFINKNSIFNTTIGINFNGTVAGKDTYATYVT